MSVSKWRYTEECNGRPCPGDCDHCSFEPGDLISRADAIEAVVTWTVEDRPHEVMPTDLVDRIKALPSAELTVQTPQTYGKSIHPSNAEVVEDLISRADAIRWVKTECNQYGKPTLDYDSGLKVIEHLKKMPSELPSDEAVQGEWAPCGEKMPKELERVNITWLNHNPPFYYQHIKDIPQIDTAVYYRGKWYWWDATVIDVLAEYGEDCNAEQIDKDIEVVAWMPLPKPYREESEVEE